MLKKAQRGDIKARNEIMECNMGLVFRVAGRKGWLEFEDCFQEGMIGLIKAIEKFKPELGYRFSTYAMNWIRQRIFRYCEDNCKLIRIPIYIQTIQNQYRRLKERQPYKTDKFYINKIARKNGTTPRLLARALKVSQTYVSIFAENDEGEPYIEIPDIIEKSEYDIDYLQLMKYLDPKERDILTRRAEGQTLKLIAIDYKVSRQRVQQIQASALQKMRSLVRLFEKGFIS